MWSEKNEKVPGSFFLRMALKGRRVRNQTLCVLLLWLAPHAFALTPDVAYQQPVAQLLKSFIERVEPGRSLYPSAWTSAMQTETLDLNSLTGEHWESGRAYGATAAKVIDRPYVAIRDLLAKPGMTWALVNNVKTLRDLEKINSEEGAEAGDLHFRTAIKVPVVSDFHTEVRLNLHELERDKREILEWRQVSDEGDLSYNQGFVLIEAVGAQTRVFAVGVHIIKLEKKVPWIGRGTASSFAKSHYANFIAALEKIL